MTQGTILFDTLAYSKKLKEAGVPEHQAEAHAEAMAETIEDKLATKSDIHKLEQDIKNIEERLTYRINELNYKLTIRMGAMMVAVIAILGTIIKL